MLYIRLMSVNYVRYGRILRSSHARQMRAFIYTYPLRRPARIIAVWPRRCRRRSSLGEMRASCWSRPRPRNREKAQPIVRAHLIYSRLYIGNNFGKGRLYGNAKGKGTLHAMCWYMKKPLILIIIIYQAHYSPSAAL